MALLEVNAKPSNEPELHLLLAPETFEPLWKLLFHGLDEFFFSKQLPPLKPESTPIPVRDIWGFYSYKKKGALGSTVAHALVLALIIYGTILGRRIATRVEGKMQTTTQLIDPGDYYPLKPAKTQSGGGGERNQWTPAQAKTCQTFSKSLFRNQRAGRDDKNSHKNNRPVASWKTGVRFYRSIQIRIPDLAGSTFYFRKVGNLG
jgi:hypothetical protein